MITRVLCQLSVSGNWPIMSFLCSRSAGKKNQATLPSVRNRLRTSKFWRLESWTGICLNISYWSKTLLTTAPVRLEELKINLWSFKCFIFYIRTGNPSTIKSIT